MVSHSFLKSQITLSSDTSFGDNGKFSTLIPNNLPQKRFEPSLYFTNDNSIIILYDKGFEPNAEMYLVKISKDGVLDSNFGNNGILSLPSYGYIGAGRIYFENHKNDGFIIVYSDHNTGGQDAIVSRYLNNGTLDTSFGNNGQIKNLQDGGSTSSQATPYSVLDDNSIIFCDGYSKIIKYNETGQVLSTTDIEPVLQSEYPFNIKKNIMYWLKAGYYSDFQFRRTNSEGVLDTTFGNNGLLNLTGHEMNESLISKKIDFFNNNNIFLLAQQIRTRSTDRNWFYSIDSNGKNYTHSYIEDQNLELNSWSYNNGIFYTVGTRTNVDSSQNAVIYAVSQNGTINNINTNPYFQEAKVENGYFNNIINEESIIYALGTEKVNNHDYIFITKYNIENKTLSSSETKNSIKIENPFTNTLKIGGLKNATEIKIYDFSGKNVIEKKLNLDNDIISINTSFLTNGVYMLNISFLDSSSKSFKIIKN